MLCASDLFVDSDHDHNNGFANSNLSTHMGGFRDPPMCRDSQCEKPCINPFTRSIDFSMTSY